MLLVALPAPDQAQYFSSNIETKGFETKTRLACD